MSIYNTVLWDYCSHCCRRIEVGDICYEVAEQSFCGQCVVKIDTGNPVVQEQKKESKRKRKRRKPTISVEICPKKDRCKHKNDCQYNYNPVSPYFLCYEREKNDNKKKS